ncbi:MAG: anaerobic ribonucleoside-triphosphate reductase activating protein [Lachnospiraceae bacterium]|nr:anaerobic ribonucleoside-triphosphate reductase activating protein [Lachnospiraceae bacterium]
MKILGLQKTTLLDYPGKIASIVFTAGCNFRCPYCQNSELITGEGCEIIPEEDVLSHLKKRAATLEGVVITGGECTLQPDLYEFCQKVKALDLSVKLDTNGRDSALVKKLIDDGLVDYVAMDIKNCKEKYAETAGIHACQDADKMLSEVYATAEFLMQGKTDYEFRTTVVEEFFEDEDLHRIGRWIKGAKAYYLQPYRDSENVLVKGFHTPKDEDMRRYRDIMQSYVENTQIRGLDL